MAVNEARLSMFKKLQTICSAVVGVEESEVKPSSHFYDDLGVSIDELAEIITRTSQAFDIKIQKEDVETISTVGDLLEFIEEQM
ncbi:MAG: acyl carrier protein [Candidatus Pacebacteria bacterium]|nr:acyl carrier protein [Candidatus Paceibacterota bacterium]